MGQRDLRCSRGDDLRVRRRFSRKLWMVVRRTSIHWHPSVIDSVADVRESFSERSEWSRHGYLQAAWSERGRSPPALTGCPTHPGASAISCRRCRHDLNIFAQRTAERRSNESSVDCAALFVQQLRGMSQASARRAGKKRLLDISFNLLIVDL